MSRVIPKEQLTAYQRWELGSFDPASAESESAMPSPESEPEALLKVTLPTAEDIERIQKEAWREGLEMGFAEGRKVGYQDGYKTGEAQAERLRQLAEAMQVESLRQDDTLAREVLELVLNVAQQMLRATIKAKPESLLVVIREALLTLPTLSGHHKVVVNPADVDMVREWLDREHGHLSWKVVEDPQMSPGGFRFESAHSELDASLETRWREITNCLGTETAWLD
ncbi:MAG: hypothetical protein COW48_09410 [Hydrogenophilales bacterium CG17_big_fil_post_rev_8_21_14_2_50_63_12]|nr:MAG: hypothetical protein COW48_09410 [Hydrogenophilales bacterium CG17_big_fil_post_rev_8_21_14_2_50_63_12]